MKRILVIAAHPDDEILGAGATMAKHAARGDEVHVLILGEGVTSRKGDELASNKLSKLRREAKAANDLIGVTSLHFADFPDNKFDSVPLLDIVQSIESTANDIQPHVVYAHHHGDINVDHQCVARSVQAAFRPMKESLTEVVYAFEIASSTEWNFTHTNIFRPNVFVGINDELLEKKLSAMEKYASEIREFPHPRSKTYLRSLATLRGGQAGMTSAEAFELVYMKHI